ncbi:hypothetical protein CMI37_27680 [Candidatus Pacearchaeota archaeon]|nr:hypothetical protein [Candidatus Pacearchaeota archaeon]|tara:strand:- start:1641 stop:2531 length:891 start_codon:yes stop_codon:yes gene_type:complete
MLEKLESFKNRKILLVGDTIIDKHVYLEAIGLSLESPTIKTQFREESIIFGGAANVAKHLSFFSDHVDFVTSINSEILRSTFEERYKLKLTNLRQKKDNIKSRFWIDRGDSKYKYLQINDINKDPSKEKEFTLNSSYDVIAVSDYRCHLIDEAIISTIRDSTFDTYIASQVSSKKNNFDSYRGFNNFVMNKSEAHSYYTPWSSSVLDRLGTSRIFVTNGDKGSRVYYKEGCSEHDAFKTEMISTMGAGDAYYAALIASSGDADFANLWASYYVSCDIEHRVRVEDFIECQKQNVFV